ncbi:DUF397 domain-containing protein [Streptomyces montanisoli]|uniref:DUF397 domain-containing protein n=1 Tax=Streptomyces montanisoli TaxID=2798581 RepID=A0A940RVY0_9ACTN|nr:DUF397 domain-containing protein [Streptomyces montanisoli]MBP0458845.1 DUF397 domain-containing protein [Streptomyces montanisoli]
MKAPALAWHKSSHSGGSGNNCVEVAETSACVLVRDSKDVTRPHMTVRAGAWRAFAVSAGRGDM